MYQSEYGGAGDKPKNWSDQFVVIVQRNIQNVILFTLPEHTDKYTS